MPFRIRCSNCGASLEANDSAMGKTLPCPKCGKQLVISAQSAAHDQSPPTGGVAAAAANSGDDATDEPDFQLADATEPSETDDDEGRPVEWYHGEEEKTAGSFVMWLILLLVCVAGGAAIFLIAGGRKGESDQAAFTKAVDNLDEFTRETKKLYDEARSLAADGKIEEAIEAYDGVLSRLGRLPMSAAKTFGYEGIQKELDALKANAARGDADAAEPAAGQDDAPAAAGGDAATEAP